MTAEHTFTISTLTFRVDAMRERLAELNKRAIKLGVPELILTVSNVRIERVRNEDFEWCDVTVTGASPVIEGEWSLLGTIDHNDGSANLLLGRVPETYRAAEPLCFHCNTVRKRTETFVIQNAQGVQMQVARQCIHNYLSIDVKRLIAWAKLAGEVREMSDWGSGVREPDKVIDFLAACVCAIRLDGGYKSRKFCYEHQRETPTDIQALGILHPTRDQIRDGWVSPVTDTDRERAQLALAWLVALPEIERAVEYRANLYAAAASSIYLPGKHSGLVASLIGFAYPNVMDEARKVRERDSLPESKHVGTVGERVRNVTIEVVREPHVSEGDFGPQTRINMRTADGSDLTWWASGDKSEEFALGTQHTIDFTPKSHGSFGGRAQTTIKNVKASKAPKVKAPRKPPSSKL